MNQSAIEVEQSAPDETGVWMFFDRISDVNDLNPAEEKQEPWTARVGGGLAGMAVVDTMPSEAFVSRVAVREPHRKCGVAAKILAKISEAHGDLSCRVHRNNDAGQALVEAAGFTRVGTWWADDRLYRYETNPNGQH